MEQIEQIDGLTLEEQTQFIETAKKIGREKVRELLKKIPGGGYVRRAGQRGYGPYQKRHQKRKTLLNGEMEMETRILIRENAEKAYTDLRDVRVLCNKINTELLPALEAMGIAPTAETVKESLRGKGAPIIEQYQADVERELRRIKIPAIRKKYEEEAAEPLQNFIAIAESFSGMPGARSAITFKDGKAFMSKAGEEAIRERFRIYAEGDQIETYRRHLEAAKALNTLMEDYPKGKEDFVNLFKTLPDGTIIPKELSYWETVCKQQEK